jgi:hypothetical protein
MRYDLEHTTFPFSMKFTFVGIRDPQRTITRRPSTILPWLIIIALGLALYTVLFAMPAAVLSLFAAPRKVLVTQATIFILLLASLRFLDCILRLRFFLGRSRRK